MLAKQLFDIFEHDLNVYKSLSFQDQASFGRDIQQSEDVLKGLSQLTEQYNSKWAKEFLKRASVIVTPDEPETQQPFEQH